MEIREGKISVPGGDVWYRVMGGGNKAPLVVLHGGPGFTCHDMFSLGALGDERPIIFYDQLGCGYSDWPSDRSLWKMERFVEELQVIVDTLQTGPFHLLGHSFGTMLAASYLLTRPHQANSVVFSSPCLSASRWAADQAQYLAEMPADIQSIIVECEQKGATDSPAYQEAVQAYYRKHVCRLDPWPQEMQDAGKNANLEVYHTMWGPSEMTPTGNLKTFDVAADLARLTIPSLFLCGRYDEATPEATRGYQQQAPNSQFHVFETGSHMTFLEEPENYIRVVRRFLHDVEATGI